MLSNLVFSDKKKLDVEQCVNHQNDRVWSRNASVEGRRVSRLQNPTSVMVWAAVTATGRSPLVAVPSGVKLNSQRYISDILECEHLPCPREHFQGAPWTFQQDSAPSHGSRMIQRWIQAHIPAFISKEDWPSRNPDPNYLDFWCDPSSRARPAKLLMIFSRIWRPSCSGTGPWSSKKFCVPRAMLFKEDWSKLLKIKESMLYKG